MTTSEPSLAVEIYQAAKAKHVHAVDAPVSGGDIGARMQPFPSWWGGSGSGQRLAAIVFRHGENDCASGRTGVGQHTKMVNQILISTGMIGVCEALLYGYKAGLDLNTVMQSVGPGAAGSWSLSNLGPRMIANNFDPGFFVEHFIKDMGIAWQNPAGWVFPYLAWHLPNNCIFQ